MTITKGQERIRSTRVDQGRRVIGSKRGNSYNEQVLSEREWLNLFCCRVLQHVAAFFAHYPSIYSTITSHESVQTVFVFSVELSYLSTLKLDLEF